MTKEEIKQWKGEFKSVVYVKGLVTVAKNKIETLSRYDKNGSHQRSILFAQESRRKAQDWLIEKLKGHTYDDWLEFSKELSALQSTLKQRKDPAAKARLQRKIDQLIF